MIIAYRSPGLEPCSLLTSSGLIGFGERKGLFVSGLGGSVIMSPDIETEFLARITNKKTIKEEKEEVFEQ